MLAAVTSKQLGQTTQVGSEPQRRQLKPTSPGLNTLPHRPKSARLPSIDCHPPSSGGKSAHRTPVSAFLITDGLVSHSGASVIMYRTKLARLAASSPAKCLATLAPLFERATLDHIDSGSRVCDLSRLALITRDYLPRFTAWIEHTVDSPADSSATKQHLESRRPGVA